MDVIYGLFIGVLATFAISGISEIRNKSYLVDKSNIIQWTRNFYGTDINKLKCYSCSDKITPENLSRIFSKNKKVYAICKKRGCHMLTNEEVIANGNTVDN